MLLTLETPYAIIPVTVIAVFVVVQLGLIFPAAPISSGPIPSAVMPEATATANITVPFSPTVPMPPPLLAFALLLIISILIYIALRERAGRDPVQERLADYGEFSKGITLREVELQISFRNRVLIPVFTQFGHLLAGFTPDQQLESIQIRLEKAGDGASPVLFQLARILLGIFFGGLVYWVLLERGGIAATVVVPILLIAVITGAYIPVAILNGRIRTRKQLIKAELPELALRLEMRCKSNLTLMSIIESLYMAWDSLTALQMGRILRETQLGKDVRYAVHDLAERVDLPDMKYLMAALASLQNNMDGLQLFIDEYRQQLYLNHIEYIRRVVRPYQMSYQIAWYYGVLAGLVLWLLAPLLGQ